MADTDYITRAERRKSALKLERVSFEAHYKELAMFIQPRRGRFFIDDQNKGGDRWQAIINSKGTDAHRTCRSGLFAGIMSPARPWFAFETPDPDMMRIQEVKEWCDKVAIILRAIFNGSNFYSSSSSMLGELILFATGAMMHMDDYEDVARFYPLTVGSYWIGQDARQVVNTLVREYQLTVGQIFENRKSGTWNGGVSPTAQTAYDQGNYDMWIPVTHIVEPNIAYADAKLEAKYKKFRSCTYEPGNTDRTIMLNDSGFDDFPAHVPRWDTTAEDIYGTDCPAMTALGDIKGMQIEERRKGQAIDKMVNPVLKGPAALRNVPIKNLPGGVNIYDGDGSKEGLTPVYTVNPQVQELRADIKEVEARVDRAFYVHLFRAISDMAGVQPRNQLELQQRDQERLLELGPVLEHLHGEFLSKAVQRTFAQCVRAGILPPAPPVLQGKVLNTRFISAIAMAQRSVAAGTIERNATFVAGLITGGFQNAGDKFDADAAIEEYGSVTGLSPRIIVDQAVVDQKRQAAASAAAQQQKLEAGKTMADTAASAGGAAQSLGATPAPGGGTALQALSNAVKLRGAPNLFNQPR